MLIFAFVTSILWSLVAILDKLVLSRYRVGTRIVILFHIIFGAFIGILLSPFYFRFECVGLNILVVIFVTAAFYLASLYYYFKAVSLEEISRVVAMSYLTPLFVAVLGKIFLKENLTSLQYVGVIMVSIGAFSISSSSEQLFKINKSLIYMFLSSIFLATDSILTKFLLMKCDFWNVFIMLRIAVFVIAVPVILKSVENFKLQGNLNVSEFFSKMKIGYILASEVLYLTGIIFFLIAMSLGSVTIANAIVSTQPLILLLLLALLYKTNKLVLEDLSLSRKVIQKIIFIVVIVVGVILIVIDLK